MRYFPYDEGHELGPRIAACVTYLVQHKITVGQLFHALLRISNKVWSHGFEHAGRRARAVGNLCRGNVLEYVAEVALGGHCSSSSLSDTDDEDTEIDEMDPEGAGGDHPPEAAIGGGDPACGGGGVSHEVVDEDKSPGDDEDDHDPEGDSETQIKHAVKRSHSDGAANADTVSKRMKM